MLLALTLLTQPAQALSCIASPVGPPLVQTELLGARGGALYVSWRGHEAPFAHRFRLRAPDGTLVPWNAHRLDDLVRFRPERPLQDGVYTLEHLHRFDEDGSYTPIGGSGDTWYPLQELSLTEPEKPTLDALRWQQDARKVLLHAETDAHRLHFEVKGLGEIGPPTWVQRDGDFRIDVFDACRDGIGVWGGDRVRAVAYGPGGARRTTRWVKLHPFPDRVGENGGEERSTRRPTWTPVDPTAPPGPTQRHDNPCGSLHVVDERRRPVPGGDRAHFRDHDGTPHTLGWDAAALWIDGTTIELEQPATPLALYGFEDDLWVYLQSGPKPSSGLEPGPSPRTIELIHLDEGTLVERFRFESDVERLAWEPGTLTLARVDGQGAVWKVTITLSGSTSVRVDVPATSVLNEVGRAGERRKVRRTMPLDGGELAFHNGLYWVGPDGATSPAYLKRPLQTLSIEDGALEVRSFRGESEVIERVTCGGPAVGLVSQR